MKLRVHLRVAAAASAMVVVLATFAAPASAGIHVDPDGPAGQEYAAPIAQAREDAAGRDGTAGVPGSTEESQAFGAGVPRDSGGGTPGGGGTEESGAGEESAAPGSSPDTSYEGDGDVLGVALLCALVLGGAAGLAFALGRRSKPGPA